MKKTVVRFLLKEGLFTAFLLLGVSFLVFLIIRLAPGDPLAALLQGQAPVDSVRAEVESALGMSQTWYGQYGQWLWQMLQGDFGASIRSGRPVLEEIISTGLNTIYLTMAAMVVTLLIAVPLAAWSALRGQSGLTWQLTVVAYSLAALPVFWLGYVAIFASTHYLGVFPLASSSSGNFGWLHFLLPVVVLGLGSGIMGETIRHLRLEIERVMQEDYIRTARAKGAPVWKHAFKEAYLLPISEIAAAKVPFLLGGAIIVEQVFNWPGMGRLAWQAAQDRDFPVIMGIAIAAAILVRLAALTRELIYVSINPQAQTS